MFGNMVHVEEFVSINKQQQKLTLNVANLRIFLEIWLQQFLCIFNISFSSAYKRWVEEKLTACI